MIQQLYSDFLNAKNDSTALFWLFYKQQLYSDFLTQETDSMQKNQTDLKIFNFPGIFMLLREVLRHTKYN